MKLLVVSHACVTPINQAFFAEVEDQSDWEISIVAPATWESEYGNRSLERWQEFEGELNPIPVWLSGNIPLHMYRTFFVSLLRRIRPDVIYVHHEPYGAATAQVYLANRFSIKRPIGFFTWQNIRKRYPIPFNHLERMVFRQSDFAVSGSESARAVLREKGYDGPADIIAAGIDVEKFGHKDLEATSLPKTSCLIGFAGRITEEKGLTTFVSALGSLSEQDWHFVLLGTGAHEPELRQQAQQLGIGDRITFLGYVDHEEVPAYLSAMDLVVLPSETKPNWKEQFGRILIEAMASGTPVLGSDSGEIPNVIRTTGGGRIFPEGDIEACADALLELVSDPELRKQLATTGQSYVKSNYTNAALAGRFIQTIERTCL